jgi:dipeptidyl aminopeptidase/acylaminoacyl peptidase
MPDVLTLAALHALVTFSDPRISPDGTRVAYVRTTRDYVHDRFAAALVVVRSDGRARHVLDPGPFVGAPRWSPDGRRLAYLRHDAKHAEDQIVVVRAAGGPARTVTRAKNGVQHFAWSPDGRRFAYVTPDDEPNATAAKRHDDVFALGDDGFLTDKPLAPSHLWLVGSGGGRAARLTHGAWSVYEAVAPFQGGPADPSWSPDGRTILIARAPDAHDAATDRSAVAAVDVASGAVRDLGTLRQYVYAPTFAPDGRTYAYVRPHGPGPISAMNAIVARPAGGDGTDRSAALDRDVQSLRWGGKTLVATAPDGLRQSIYVIPPQGAPRRVDLGELSVTDVGAGPHGELAFVASSFARPPEVYVVRAPGAPARAISADNVALRRFAYGRAEALRWTAPDGQVSDGILVHPVGERPGRTYPLVVWHHGGPEFAAALSFDEGSDDGAPFGALAAARGWYAFLPNYRGSDDLGTAHEHAIYQDPGAGPMSDTMAGLAAVEGRARIDRSRECVGGHSYGGFMTSWIIGHDSRWRCAVVADGSLDLVAAYDLSGTGNLAFTRDSMGGSPWRGPAAALYRDGSPLAYAPKVRTPTLIITGLADQVVPYTESFEYYHALRDNGVPVRLVGIPTAHHTPSDPVRLESYQRTIWNWLAAHLGAR